MKLVKISNYNLEINDELLLLTPFKKLYSSDKTKSKLQFMEFLTILYYVYDPRSDYMYISNENDRLEEVCLTNGIGKHKFTELELECIKLYKDLTKTSSSMLLEDTRITIDKIREMLKSIDFENLEEKDKVNAIKSVASTVSMIPKLVKDLTEAEKAVVKEIEEQGRARGGNNKKLFEDGITL
jgi:hypothetical protein